MKTNPFTMKMAKILILVGCLTAFSAGTAFADTGSGTVPGTPAIQQAKSGDALESKHREIDQYVFEQHAKELADKGITVTNTGVNGDAVEIGITPYTQQNADYLYGIFGKDGVRVFEGQQAVTLGTVGSAAPTAAKETAMTAEKSAPANGTPASDTRLYVIIAAAAILGCGAFIARRLKTGVRHS